MRVALLALALLAQDPGKHYDRAVHEATKTFAYEEFLVVPVRVHILHSRAQPSLNSKLTEADVRRIFAKVNRIWHMSGIALHLESIRTEEAAVPPGFAGTKAGLDDYNEVRPAGSRGGNVAHVYYVHAMRVNGVHLGKSRTVFVADNATLTQVKGGVDEPLPRVTGHELGHHMGGLKHRQNRINLMASGTTGWSVNDAEIATVRRWAKRQAWVLEPEEALEKEWHDTLAGIPGSPVIKRKGRGEAVPWLGVQIEEKDGVVHVTRTYISGSTARSLKLKKRDVIIEVDGTKIESEKALREAVAAMKIGQPLEVTVRRGKKTLSLKGTVRSQPRAVARWPDLKKAGWF